MHAQFGIVLHSSGPLCFVGIFTDFSHEFFVEGQDTAQQMKAKDDGTSVEQTKVNMVDSWRLVARAIWNCPSQFWSVMFCRDFHGFFSRIFLSKVKTQHNRWRQRWNDEQFHKLHDVVLLLPRRRKQKIDMIQFQICKEGEGNADEKEFFISRWRMRRRKFVCLIYN